MTYCYYFFPKSSRGEEQELAEGGQEGPSWLSTVGREGSALLTAPRFGVRRGQHFVSVGPDMPRSHLHISRNRAIGSQQPLTLTHHCFGVRC